MAQGATGCGLHSWRALPLPVPMPTLTLRLGNKEVGQGLAVSSCTFAATVPSLPPHKCGMGVGSSWWGTVPGLGS